MSTPIPRIKHYTDRHCFDLSECPTDIDGALAVFKEIVAKIEKAKASEATGVEVDFNVDIVSRLDREGDPMHTIGVGEITIQMAHYETEDEAKARVAAEEEQRQARLREEGEQERERLEKSIATHRQHLLKAEEDLFLLTKAGGLSCEKTTSGRTRWTPVNRT